MMPQGTKFVGVDVSKAELEVCGLGEARSRRIKNRPEGWARLIKELPAGAVVGIEPSGGYERGVVRALLVAGVDVRWADPGRVRALARALGAPAKTDAIDAQLIAHFVAHAGGRPVRLDPEREQLRDLLAARSAAIETANLLKAQAEALEPGPGRAALDRLQAASRQEAINLTGAATDLIGACPALAQPWRLLQSAPGVGPQVAAELLAHMPELGAVSRKAIAKLAGLAPFIRESGAWRGKAVCSGGRPRPRQLLYLAAMAAIRACAQLKARFERLVAKGKPKMVALNACMRSLLTALNAMIRDQRPWTPASL
jgi:transposase